MVSRSALTGTPGRRSPKALDHPTQGQTGHKGEQWYSDEPCSDIEVDRTTYREKHLLTNVVAQKMIHEPEINTQMRNKPLRKLIEGSAPARVCGPPSRE